MRTWYDGGAHAPRRSAATNTFGALEPNCSLSSQRLVSRPTRASAKHANCATRRAVCLSEVYAMCNFAEQVLAAACSRIGALIALLSCTTTKQQQSEKNMNKHSRLPEPVQAPVSGTALRSNDRGYGPHCAQNPFPPPPTYVAQAGFTLTELVVVVAVVGVLAAAASVAIGPSERAPGRSPAAIGAALVDVSGDTHSMSKSTATSADALAAGYPPDVRGRMKTTVHYCPGTVRGIAEPVPSDLGFDCSTSMFTYVQVRVERLKANGGFELISKQYIPFSSSAIVNGNVVPYDGVLAMYATPGAYVSNGIAQCVNDPYGNVNWFCFDNELMRSRNASPVAAEILGHQDTPFEVRCYVNGTCDPVTYWFAIETPGQVHLSRIAVTPFGSIANIPSWQ